MVRTAEMKNRAEKLALLSEPTAVAGDRALDSTAAPGSGSVAGSDLAELVAQLRADIVQARYGADEPLRFRALANAYGAGVSTLREALARLAGEYLVEFRPNQGFRVAAVSVEDLIDIMQASSEIERVALRQSIDSGDDHWEAGIVAAHHRLLLTQSRLENGRSSEAAQEWEVRHREFHQALIAGCRSRWLIRFCEMLRIQCDRYRHLVSVPPSDYPRLIIHHAPLMEAALARDPDRACRLLATHVEESANVILAALGKQK
jgi:GntR family transcriptional regulator, carbon starvation induced regulator